MLETSFSYRNTTIWLQRGRLCWRLAPVLALAALTPIRAHAQPVPVVAASETGPSYADLADLSDSAPLVLRAEVRKQAVVEPERSGKLRQGWVRLYLQVRTQALLVGSRPIGEGLAYLADVPLDGRGRIPALKHTIVLAFAREVPGRPAELQLVAPDAQLAWSAGTEQRLGAVLAELRAPDAPARIDAVREAMFVPGTLAGAGETQISLATAHGGPASISVTHEPGQPTVWAASFGEVFDTSGKPPPRDTLPWYRLACFLPRSLPDGANLSGTDSDRAQAAADYRLVIDGLGACRRTRS